MNLSLFGQNFISPDKEWNVRLIIDLSTVMTETFKIKGDSVVNLISYNKIWQSNDSLSSWGFQGLLREESDMVYYISPNSTSEGLLYNFTLEIGDTAFVRNMFSGDEEVPIYVVNIDTVEYFGISRKRWHLGESGNVEEFWVEGIGSINGLLYTKYWDYIVCPVWELLCYHDNEILEYIMPGETDCYINTVGTNENHNESEFSIKPNPVKKGNTIYIETNSVPNSISVFNSSGLLIKRLNQIRDKIIRIKTNDFKPGMYFITIKTTGDRIKTQKIIIK